MDLELVGKTLADRYLVEERIGSGAMGEVYRARHIKVGRSFAVKVLHPELLSDPKVRLRFDREAELAGTLKHPHIVGVVDVGETPEGLRYMVMEHAVGEPLSIVIATGPMTAARAIPILRQCSDALNHAHDRGLVHRDLKPDNIIVEHRVDGTDYVKIIDLGIAILRDDLSESSATKERITTAGVLLGTPQYLAPEQAFGSGDHRIDLFALGIIAYEMLTGRLPYDGEGAEVARANLVSETPPMGVRVPFLDVDPLLEALTRKLMAKKPEQRPQTGKAVCDLLDLIEANRPAAAVALGVDLAFTSNPIDESRPVVRTAESSRLQSENDLAIAVERPSRPTAESVPMPPLEVGTARAQSSGPPTRPHRSRRGLVIGGTAAVAVAIGALAIGFSSNYNKTDSLATVATQATQTPGTQPTAGSSTQAQTPTAGSTAQTPTTQTPTAGSSTQTPTTQTPTQTLTTQTPTAGTQTPTTQTPTAGTQTPTAGSSTQTPTTQTPTAGSSTQTPTATPSTQTQTPSPATTTSPTTAKPTTTKPTTTKPTTTKPTTTKPTILKPPPADAPDPTANELAALYIAVGRDLKAYADKKGTKAEALSLRYRMIKISDAMGAGDRRRVAANELWSIRVAAR